jgi:hypothetical protein
LRQENTIVFSIAPMYGCQYMMHESADHVQPFVTGDVMATSAREYDSHAPVFTSGDRIVAPPNAIALLRESIKARKDGRDLNEKIRSAAALICDEARRIEAVPEKLVLSIKEMCHSLPEYEMIRGARERDAFVSVVVTLAIEEYYRR